MMLDQMSASEYVDWLAYFSVDWSTYKSKQSPDQIKANLSLSLAGKKKKKSHAA